MDAPPPMTDDSEDAVVRAIVEHDEFLVRTLVRLAGLELHEDEGATWYLSGVPEPLFNGVLRMNLDDATADRTIDQLVGRFRAAGVPALWWTGPLSTPPDLPARLVARGLAGTTLPGMSLDLRGFEPPAPPAGLRIEVVTNEEELDRWMWAAMAGFDIESRFVDRFRRTPEAVLAGDVPGWCVTGVVDGRATATAMVCVGTGVAGGSNIATVPDHRRRGIGAAVTGHAFAMARDLGYATAVLTSTEEGRPLYEALGFRTRCLVDQFVQEVRPTGEGATAGGS